MSKVIRAVVGIGLFVAGVFMGGSTWPLAVMALGGGLAASAITPKIETPAVSEATGGRLNADLQPEAYRKIPFGVTALATDTRYWEVSGADQKNYDQVIALAGCKITSLDAIYIEDELVTFDGSGNAVGKYAGALSRKFTVEGVSGQALTGVGTGTRWNTASGESASMTGMAHLVLKWVWSQEKLPRGFPTRITPVGKGSPVYDPRRDSTRGGSGSHRADDQSTWEFSPLDSNGEPIGRSGALQILRYLIGWRIENPSTGEMVLVDGMGVDLDDINFDEFIQAANDCETEEYYSDCLLSTGDTHATNLAVLEQACAGKVSDAGGRYGLRIQVDDFAGDAVEFTDSDIVGECDWRPEMPLAQSAFNQVSVQFVDPGALYQLRTAPLVRDAAYEAADGAKERTNMRLDAVQDGEQAQKLARLMLNKSRRKGVFEAPFGWRAVNVKVGQPVKLTLSRFGFDERWFRVRATKVDPGGAVWMALEDDDPSVYAGGTVSPVPPAATGAGYDPLSVATPDADDWNITVGGPAIGRPGGPSIVVTPEPAVASLAALRSVLVHIRLSGLDPEAVWTLYGEFALATLESIEITGLFPNTAYEVRLQYRNGHGAIDPQATQVFGPVTTGGLTATDATIPSEKIDAARDAINEARGELTENLEEANQTLEYAVTGLAVDSQRALQDARLGAQVSLLNRLSDPLLDTGVDGWNAVGGAVLPVAGSPRALQAVWNIAEAGRPSGQYLQWPVKWRVTEGDGVQVGVEVGLFGAGSDIVLEAVWIDATGDALSSTEIATGSSGRLEGVAQAPADSAEVTIRMAPVASEPGMGGFLVRRPLAASALPGQATVDAFTAPENELVARLDRLERVVGNIAESSRTLQVETRSGRASIRTNEQAIITESEARAQLGVTLNTTLQNNYLTAAQVGQTYLAISGLENAFAGIDVSVNATLEGVITKVNGLPATVYSQAAADAKFLASANLEQSVAQIDLSANAAFDAIATTVNGLPADILTESEANQTFLAIADLEQSVAGIDLSANAAFAATVTKVDGLPDTVYSQAAADAKFLASANLDTALSSIDFTTYASFNNNTSRVVRAASAPYIPDYKAGDIWINTSSGELRVHNGSGWDSTTLATLAYSNANFRTQSQVDSQISSFNFAALSYFNEMNAQVEVNATAISDLEDSAAQLNIVVAASGSTPATAELISGGGGSAVNLSATEIVLKTNSGGTLKTALKGVDGNVLIPNTLLLGESGNITTPVVSGRFIRFGVIDGAMRFEAFDGSEYAISCNLSTGVFAINGANLTNASVGAEKIPLREITAPNAAPTTTFGPWAVGEYAQLGNVRGWALQHLICPLDDVSGGARLDIDWDYDFSFQGKAAQFFTWWERVYLLPVSSGLPGYRQSTGLINSRLCEQGAGNTNNTAISPTAINANKWLAFPRGGSKQIVLPADAGSVAYRVILQLCLDRDEIDHSSGNQNGILNPNGSYQYAFESCDLRATALKR